MITSNRILIVDDSESIHEDFLKTLTDVRRSILKDISALEEKLFSGTPSPRIKVPEINPYRIDSAYQGKEGYEMICRAEAKRDPFALVFVDVRMPPGWDGVETATRILNENPDIELVLCSAYSDYAWEEIIDRLGVTDRVLFLSKPFDQISVKQMAWALTKKYALRRENRLQTEALLKAREEAESASKEKSIFLSNMSHEIRTPLNGVIGISELLKQTKLDGKQEDLVHSIAYSADILLELIDEILDFAKIESGKIVLENIPFDLRKLVDELCRAFRFRFQKADLQLDSQLSEMLPRWLRGDPTRLRQVLNNLLSNALKFTDEGGAELMVTERRITPKKATLRFQVQDSGIGISRQGQTRLFQPFSQVDFSTTRKYGGTGLGLEISRRMIELMGGRVKVKSKLGSGATFWFDITLERLTAGERNEVETAPSPEPQQPRTRDALILMAEDNRINQKVVKHMLGRAGYRCHVVDCGNAVLKAVEQARYDLVLMDCQMPGMDGFEASRQIRRFEQKTDLHLPIIALTASAVSGDRERCMAAGMDDYITKPIRQKTLYSTIEKWLDAKTQPKEERPTAP